MNILDLAKQMKALKDLPSLEASSVEFQKKWILYVVNAAPQLADAVIGLTASNAALQAENDILSQDMYDMNLELLKMDALQAKLKLAGAFIAKLANETHTVTRYAFREDGDPMEWTEQELTLSATEARELLTRLKEGE